MTRLFILVLLLSSFAWKGLAQPQIDWAHHISSVDSSFFLRPIITDAHVDVNGDLIITGAIQGNYDLDSDQKEDVSTSGKIDMFVASYSREGTLNWAQTTGADSLAAGLAIATDELGNVYVTGQGLYISDLNGDDFPDIERDSLSMFLVKYDQMGRLQWATSHEQPVEFPAKMLFHEERQELIVAGADNSLCLQQMESGNCTIHLSQITVASYSPEGTTNWTRKLNAVPTDSVSYIDIEHLSLNSEGDIQIAGNLRGSVDLYDSDSFPPLTKPLDSFRIRSPYRATLSEDGAVLNQELFSYSFPFPNQIALNPDGSTFLASGLFPRSSADSTLPGGHVMYINQERTNQWGHTFYSPDSTSFAIFNHEIDTDPQSNLYLSGSVSGNLDMDSDGISDILFAPASEQAFFAKYQAQGLIDWVFYLDHEPFSNSSSIGQWIVTREGTSIYAIAFFKGTVDPDGPESIAPITARTNSSQLTDMLILHITSPLTSISVDDQPLPVTTALSSAYPNPFSTRTSFTIEAEETQQIAITLYNALGQKVKTLYEGLLFQNEQKTVNLEATGLPSGLYIIQTQGEHFTSSQKLVKVR